MSNLLDEAVRRHARVKPDAPAIVDAAGTLTWGEWDVEADRVARALAAAGVGPRGRVALLARNGTAYGPVLLGVWRAGAVLANLNWRMPAHSLRATLESIGAAHLLVGPGCAEAAEQARIESMGITALAHTAPYVAAPPGPGGPAGVPEARPGDEAAVYFTSGTTGIPKAVSLSHAAVAAAVARGTVHGFAGDSRSLIVSPTFHAAGAIWFNYGLLAGATQYFHDDAAPPALVGALHRHRITHALMVPTLLHAVVTELDAHPVRLDALRHVGYGASPITPALLRSSLAALGCEFCQVYGMTELGGAICLLAPDDHVPEGPGAVRLESAGRPGPAARVSVREVGTLDEVAPGREGELWFTAPSLMTGYVGRPEETARVLVDGWFNTRDIGYVDDEGYVYVRGRSDDMIVTGAENVHPGEVENVLSELPEVSECAVFGVPDDAWGRRLVAAVVPRGEIGIDRIDAHCHARLAGYKCPKDIVFVSELPRSATGKVLRRDLPGLIGVHS